jgi:putative SOS response-associated peptidase YedK
MCGRFVQTDSPKKLSERMRLPEGSLFDRPRFNVAPTQPIAVIRPGELVALRWGLVPSWSKDGKGFINARAETAAEKPTFRSAFKKWRCLIPADGFYEWRKTEEGKKQPYLIRMRDNEPFAFAGLWEGETCAILTTTANDLMRPIHERMPVILAPENYERWLAEPDASVLRSFPAEGMTAYPVSTYVNNAKQEGPKCTEPLEHGTDEVN